MGEATEYQSAPTEKHKLKDKKKDSLQKFKFPDKKNSDAPFNINPKSLKSSKE